MRALPVHIAHETSGAARIRHSLRPLISRGAENTCKPRAHCAARMRRCVRGCLTFESVSAPQLSSPGLTGRPSIPETPMIEPKSRGVLDHPLSRVTTGECDAPPCPCDATAVAFRWCSVCHVPQPSVFPLIDNAADRSTMLSGRLETGPSQAGNAMADELHRQRVLN